MPDLALSGQDRDAGAPARDVALLTLRDVSAGYDATAALQDVDLQAFAGQRIGVLGPNGGGKTTLFRVVLGELPARTGTVDLQADVAVVPQTERSRLDFPVSALDVVLMGTIADRPWWRPARRGDRRAALEALDAVGLADRADTTFGVLSGGQRQRVLVARALVRDARVLLLDEPYRGLDRTSCDRLEALTRDLADRGHVLLIATHDVGQTRPWDRVLCLNRRQVAFGAPGEVLTPETLAATYGSELLRIGDEAVAVVAEHRHR